MSLVPTHGAEGGADNFEGDQLDDELMELLDELLGDGAELIQWEQGKKKRKKPGKGPRCSINQRRRSHTGGRPQKATATVRVATNGLMSVLQGMARQRLTGTISRVFTFRSKLGMSTAELAAFAEYARDAYAEEYRDALMGRNRDGIGTLACVGEFNGDPCPNAATAVPLSEVGQLGVLQLDHEFEFRLIMKKWAYARQQLEERPTTWDAGINPGLLCHLLFSLAPSAEHGMEWVRPRCSQCHVNCPHERAKPSFVL